jgi:putative transposase
LGTSHLVNKEQEEAHRSRPQAKSFGTFQGECKEKEKNIWIDTVNSVSDHVHVLISLGAEQSISKVVMLLKGESSHWINVHNLTNSKFEWQDEYITVSVSESNVETVRRYILNQEEHHRKKSFAEEYDEFMKNYGTYIGT